MKNKSLLFAICCLFAFASNAQELTGKQLLEKAIAYHDPANSWAQFKGNFVVTMTTPNKVSRVSDIQINLPGNTFVLTNTRDGNKITSTLNNGDCVLSVNDSIITDAAELKKHKLNCDRVKMMKNYYTYLYGLPMKLNDNGTIIAEEVQTKTFKGKTYLVLKATYEESVGKDTWYFYFDPKTYAMEVYQFFHDESKNDGEYILLTEEEEVNGIKMPKTRAWYYNKDDKHLGTDVLSKQ